jgi:TetR/AcrR family transcriptional regulator, regulator of cefoperazone and chloramphenicol sensitivity
MESRPGSVLVRGEATRAALVDAATRVFGRDGFSAATTKAIAAEAGANQALISYYFGGKEGLYRAVVEHIVDSIGARMRPVAARVESERRAIESRGGNEAVSQRYFELLCRLLDAFVDLLTSEESAAWAKIIVREQQEPSAAFDVLYGRVQGRLLEQAAGLVARIGGRAAPSAADRLTALAVVGQVLVFRMARATALRFLGWETLRPQEIARIKRTLRRHTGAMLGVSGGGNDA